MKNIVLILFAITVFMAPGKTETSPTFFTEGQQLFVVANSGLNLRETPDKSSATYVTIPYGAMVTVMPFDQQCVVLQEIEYVRGSWTKISYSGYIGYVFDGFLSPLSVPRYHAEITEGNVSIFNLIDNWVDIHLIATDSPDTIVTEQTKKILYNFEGGEKYEKQLYNNGYRTQLFLSGVRIMDVYHLVKGFYSVDLKEELDLNSLFIKDNDGNLRQIKIKTDNPCSIRVLKNGQIRLTIDQPMTGC